ncbi:MAG TPA: CHAP domain-containing protein, partial [Candidatus Saccharimonadaceae bacterium]|nr:CHAP domain-containing protein [Candidatus Saccharimonadaceae bacterium]
DVVQPGDSLSKIAQVEGTTWVRLFDANADIADPNIIHPGEKVSVPLANQQLPDRYGQLTAQQVATMPTVASPAPVASNVPAEQSASTSTQPTGASVGGPNGYVWGECTWYVKNMRPDISGYWGNAGYNWIAEAAAAGFTTGSTPRAGAVAVEAGHVAYVQSVSGDNVYISEMNYAGGIGQVHYRTVPADEFEYIY